ncbi:MAG TPA: type II toxin-antitoxin system prevent-host-death family antitoxin [Vicinamibacterales bacterium]|nr:type II toxin-antitoxin system prevent-host-death family antitoxin [Vicinamibacterales bacterium]
MVKAHTIHAAKTQLSRLIARARRGETVVIARGSQPVVKIVPIDDERPKRRFGAMRGRARVTRAFFAPLPAEELAAWGE